jgi:hypothetical protein
MPDQPRDGGDAYQEHDGSGGEQETHEPHQQAHYRSSVSTLAPVPPAFSSAKPLRGDVPFTQTNNASAGREFRSIPQALAVVFIEPPLWPN